jgi:hypothetical protein
MDDSTIGKHTKRVMTERGKRKLRHDSTRGRYIDMLHASVWYVHPFDPTILPIDDIQQRVAVIYIKPHLVLEVEKD